MAVQMNGNIRLIGLLMIIVVGTIGWLTTPTTLKFDNNIIKNLPTMFGYLVLISLFVERSIEVFLSAWRSQEADILDLDISNKRLRIQDCISQASGQEQGYTDSDKDIIKNLKIDLQSLERDRIMYSANSRFTAQWLGLLIGMMVSIIGIRVLANIVSMDSLPNNQQGAFIVVDIIITGAVLAGGSDAINKIMKIYNNAMTSTATKIKSS